MLLLEIKRSGIYLTTDRRNEMLEAMEFLRREYDKMESMGTMQRTVYDFRDHKNVIPKITG